MCGQALVLERERSISSLTRHVLFPMIGPVRFAYKVAEPYAFQPQPVLYVTLQPKACQISKKDEWEKKKFDEIQYDF